MEFTENAKKMHLKCTYACISAYYNKNTDLRIMISYCQSLAPNPLRDEISLRLHFLSMMLLRNGKSSRSISDDESISSKKSCNKRNSTLSSRSLFSSNHSIMKKIFLIWLALVLPRLNNTSLSFLSFFYIATCTLVILNINVWVGSRPIKVLEMIREDVYKE